MSSPYVFTSFCLSSNFECEHVSTYRLLQLNFILRWRRPGRPTYISGAFPRLGEARSFARFGKRWLLRYEHCRVSCVSCDALLLQRDELGALVSLEMGKIRTEGVGEVQEFIDIVSLLWTGYVDSTSLKPRPGV